VFNPFTFRLDACTTEEQRDAVRRSCRIADSDDEADEEKWQGYFDEYAAGLLAEEEEGERKQESKREKKREMIRAKRQMDEESEERDYREALAKQKAREERKKDKHKKREGGESDVGSKGKRDKDRTGMPARPRSGKSHEMDGDSHVSAVFDEEDGGDMSD
jgi:hypothetical protein